MPRKLLDVSRMHALGWRHRIALREGIASTYRWFLDHLEMFRTRRGRCRRRYAATQRSAVRARGGLTVGIVRGLPKVPGECPWQKGARASTVAPVPSTGICFLGHVSHQQCR